MTDEIAYNTADLDDGYEAHLLTVEQISTSVALFQGCFREVQTLYPQAVEKLQFNETLKRIFDRLVGDLISNTQQGLKSAGVRSLEDIRRHRQRLAAFSPPVEQERRQLKDFLYENLYFSPALAGEKEDAERIIGELFAHSAVDQPEQFGEGRLRLDRNDAGAQAAKGGNAVADMCAHVKHQIATLDESAIEPIHGRRTGPIAVVDSQRADDAACGPEGVAHRIKPCWAVETALLSLWQAASRHAARPEALILRAAAQGRYARTESPATATH